MKGKVFDMVEAKIAVVILVAAAFCVMFAACSLPL